MLRFFMVLTFFSYVTKERYMFDSNVEEWGKFLLNQPVLYAVNEKLSSKKFKK